MYSIGKKLRYLFGALFLVAWLISAVHLGKQHWKLNRSNEATKVEQVVSSEAKTTIENSSLFLTTFVGVIQYIYNR